LACGRKKVGWVIRLSQIGLYMGVYRGIPMTMRISDETKEKLKRLKEMKGLESLDETVDYLWETNNPVYGQLSSWLREIVPFGNTGEYVLWEERDDWWHARIYTKDHRYTITTHKDGRYLGCQAKTTFHRPGEDWTRGNDLPDGPFNRETWEAIKNRMVGYELQPLSDYILNPPETDTKKIGEMDETPPPPEEEAEQD